MDNVIASMLILAAWFLSIVLPFFITDNKKYVEIKSDNALKIAREKSHFLKQ